MRKKRQLKKRDALLKELDQSIDYLCKVFRIPGYTSKDLKQELILKVLEDWEKYKSKKRGKGFWYLRLKWHLLNMVKAAQREPMNLAVNLKLFNPEQ